MLTVRIISRLFTNVIFQSLHLSTKASKMAEDTYTIFTGNIIHCDKLFSMETLENGFIIVKGSKIVAVNQLDHLEETKKNLEIQKWESIILKDTQLLIPGLIDTHIHAPQYPNAGLGYDLPLLDWLQKYTYNLEAKYSDLEFSKKVYDAIVKKTLGYGTTTACYFGSLFRESCMVLVDSVLHHGQRALVGKINMTRLAPENYLETPEDSIKETETFINDVLDKKSRLVKPIITPRFALSVELDLMKKLADLASKYSCHIQTHISENCDEVCTVKKMFVCNDYADVYHEANLLTKQTILAHGIHLTDDELKLLSRKGSSIAHCPSSNSRLQSGLCDVRRLIEYDVSVGLGTDVSGGHSPSIIEAMRSAVDTSIHLSYGKPDYRHINCYDAFCLATLGGAKALSLDDQIGNFKVGKDFDALIIDMDVANGAVDFLQSCNASELLQKFVYLGDDRNIISVYVAGNKVK